MCALSTQAVISRLELATVGRPTSVTPPAGRYTVPVCCKTTLIWQRPPKMAPAKRHAYEAQFKLQALNYAVLNGSRAAARKFKINESMVRKWRKQENELRQVKKAKQSFRGNKARWQELEDQLEQWVLEQRTAGRSVSTVSIPLKAITIAQDMKIKHFQGGLSWCFRFMKSRHLAIPARTTVVQQLQRITKKS